MKRNLLFSLMVFINCNVAIPQVIEITFTATFNSLHCPLDSINIQNLTAGGDTTLYGTDTVLVLVDISGVDRTDAGHYKGLTLFPCYPNPSSGSATVRFYLTEGELVTVRVFDIMGREHIRNSQMLNSGYHAYSFIPGQERIWFISVETTSQRKVQKLINILGGEAACRIEYMGMQGESGREYRKGITSLPWTSGDILRIYGFATHPGTTTSLHQIHQMTPLQSEVVTLNLLEGMPCRGVPFAYDIDNNSYRTIKIGNRCWTRENLMTTRYNNGVSIPHIADDFLWVTDTLGARCYYDNDSTTLSRLYGALYNVYALSLDKLCPKGWHVPTDSEFVALSNFLGGDSLAGNKLKVQGVSNWSGNNNNSTNEVGFSALPGGERFSSYSIFSGYIVFYSGFQMTGNWWTSTEKLGGLTWYMRVLHHLKSSMGSTYRLNNFGLSVRCIMNDTASGQSAPMSDFTITPNHVTIHDTIQFNDATLYNPLWWKWYFGDGGSSHLQNPTHVYTAKGSYTVTLITGNQWGTDTLVKPSFIQATGPVIPYPVVDFDGNNYDTIDVNNQIWLKQNLRTTKYNDGGPIIELPLAGLWSVANVGARCWHNNDSATYASVTGGLYNWYAVETGKLCPQGFRVPTFAEWNTFVNYIGGDSIAGGILKEVGLVHWNSPNTGAANTLGFTALPGGQRSGDATAGFSGIGTNGYWWCSSSFGAQSTWNVVMSNTSAAVNWGFSNKRNGMAVRCILE